VVDWSNTTAILEAFEASREKRATSTRDLPVQLLTTEKPQNPASKFVFPTVKPKLIFPKTVSKNTSTVLNQNDCRPFGGKSYAPAHYDQLVTLTATFFLDATGTVRSGFNGISYDIGPIPVIFEVMGNLSIPEQIHPIRTPLGKVIDT